MISVHYRWPLKFSPLPFDCQLAQYLLGEMEAAETPMMQTLIVRANSTLFFTNATARAINYANISPRVTLYIITDNFMRLITLSCLIKHFRPFHHRSCFADKCVFACVPIYLGAIARHVHTATVRAERAAWKKSGTSFALTRGAACVYAYYALRAGV